MLTRDVALAGGTEDQPLFRRIVSAITTDIERGRLRRGARLVSSRTLAGQLGVSRNTVVVAYDELCALGWITIEGTRGARVAGVPRERRPDRPAEAPAPDDPHADGLELPAALVPQPPEPGMLVLLGGVPELRGLPYRAMARAYRSALLGRSARRLVDGSHPQGSLPLRLALTRLMSSARGLAPSVDAITVVPGSTHGVQLAARALLRPGDVVAVEATGYQPAWRALERAGAVLAPIPVDRGGLDVDALAAAHATRAIRAVYTTPHHQYPTTVTLAPARRQRLLELARAHRMVIFEDDYDFDFHYDGPPVLPLAARDRAGTVVYFGTLSRTLAPDLRVGYIVASPDVTQRIAAHGGAVDAHGDPALEHAIALLLEDGAVQRHLRRARRLCRVRRDALCEALRRRLPQLVFDVPSGGTAVWARAPGVDTAAWAQRGLACGVAFQPGRAFAADDHAHDFVRLGFAACSEPELVEAVDRMVRALPA